MDTNLKILLIAFVTGSMTLAPSLIFVNSVAAAPYYCKDYKGVSQNWINGCQQGWWDHNHCNAYDPDGESNAFYNGYIVGWKKGECPSAPSHYCSDYFGKSNAWINGCQQGWWDHNHCWGYSPGTGDYAKGYSVGWTKGQCK
jgi:hypothetical protein